MHSAPGACAGPKQNAVYESAPQLETGGVRSGGWKRTVRTLDKVL